jgi:hypothetical protein
VIELLQTYKKQAMVYLITHKANNAELPKDLLEAFVCFLYVRDKILGQDLSEAFVCFLYVRDKILGQLCIVCFVCDKIRHNLLLVCF